ncbi:hypothetical protein N0V90_001174 [Kalmusia sp. IMI 367209]|nr:hypothetical protein N0V90_001174 [Kalmusia sp. IMI 367209]
MAGRDSIRNPRLRLACARCQRRKIRCDAQLPTCTNCRKAAAECTDGESLRLRHVAEDHLVASRLRTRVTWLESIIRERLPDVDLTVETQPETPEPHGERTASFTHGDRRDASTQDVLSSSQPSAPPQAVTLPNERAHEIGLIAVGVNSDQRYLGPSSGYFLARLLLSCSPRREDPDRHGRTSAAVAQSIVDQLVEATHGPLPLPARAHATELARIYFDVVHPQYPVIHEPSLMQSLYRLYEEDPNTVETDVFGCFQVNMVLAIASNVLSFRTRCHVPGESYCLSALQFLGRLNVQNSLAGLQCILLLLIFTIHSPYMRLNVWYLNYHCIAAVLDLGLQRDITTSSGITLLDQEMRTRVFWTVFTLDRTIATMMGRPIGLRDEACELRLPQDLDDHILVGALDTDASPTGSMAVSIHLFKLAKINSEIKYVANSIVRDAPSYAYPTIGDIKAWQRGMLEQLDQWASTIPPTQRRLGYISILCELRYYSVKILLLRPSPAIPRPSTESLAECYCLAWRAIQLYDQLYRQDLLVYDWVALHGIIFSTITALYCLRAVPDLARRTELDELMNNLSLSLSLVSAAGEHWSGPKRSRHILDDLAKSTISWMKALKSAADSNLESGAAHNNQRNQLPLTSDIPDETNPMSTVLSNGFPSFTPTMLPSSVMPPGLANLDNAYWPDQIQQFGFGDIVNVDEMMHSLFEDFIPQVNSSVPASQF